MKAVVTDFPFETHFAGEIHSGFAELRSHAGVCPVRLPSGASAWLAVGYDEVRTVLGDPRFSRSIRYANISHSKNGAAAADGCPVPASQAPPGRSLGMDGPAHLALRRLTGQAFTARRVEALRPRVQALTDELIDAMEEHGPPADLMVHVAAALPMVMICELLGLPGEDREQFGIWSRHMMNAHHAEGDNAVAAAHARREMDDYLMLTIALKREQNSQDDLLSGMIRARDGDDQLADSEIVDLTKAMLIAGHTTTVSMIGLGCWRLFRHPEQLAALRADPSLVAGAVEEILRYQPQGTFGMPQVATEDVELGGVLIKKGELVFAPTYAANRDGHQFSDPDRFDICRRENGHVTFGYGHHFCLGAALARAEMQIVYTSLLRRFPNLRLAIPLDEVRWHEQDLVCSPAELPLSW